MPTENDEVIRTEQIGSVLLKLKVFWQFYQMINTQITPLTLALAPSVHTVLFSSQKMVVRGCCHCCHSYIVFSLAPCHCWLISLVLCHLEIHQITLFSLSWIRQGGEKHRLRDDQRGPTFTSHWHTNWETKTWGGKVKNRFKQRKKLSLGCLVQGIQIILTYLLLVYVYIIAVAQTHIKSILIH